MAQFIEGYSKYYICGVPGFYAVKTCGNNRIVARDFETIEQARDWILN